MKSITTSKDLPRDITPDMSGDLKPYFLHRAKEAFKYHQSTRLGHMHEPLNADPRPLAYWAQQKFGEHQGRGVIVAIDGELIAETFIAGDVEISVWGVEPADMRKYGLIIDSNRVDMALGTLGREVGKELFHVPGWMVCQGPGRKTHQQEHK